MTGNALIAEIVQSGQAPERADDLLAGIIDGKLLLPIDDAGNVAFVEGPDGKPWLPGFVDEAALLERMPDSRGVLCDVVQVMQVWQATGVSILMVSAGPDWVTVPLALIARTLQERVREQSVQQGPSGEMTLHLRRSDHANALWLREALAAEILDHPRVDGVWLAHARWQETGEEQLLLHFACSGDDPGQSAAELMRAVLAEAAHLDPEGPVLASRALATGTDEMFFKEIDKLGLDTVRADHSARTVEVTWLR